MKIINPGRLALPGHAFSKLRVQALAQDVKAPKGLSRPQLGLQLSSAQEDQTHFLHPQQPAVSARRPTIHAQTRCWESLCALSVAPRPSPLGSRPGCYHCALVLQYER